jgi:hypothetical protein
VYGLTTLTKLTLGEMRHEDGVPVEDGGEWVLDLSRLTTLTRLDLAWCTTATDEQVRAVRLGLPGLTRLDIRNCNNVTPAELQALRTARPELTLDVP